MGEYAMVDVFAVADIIVRHIKQRYSQDVAIVGYYGSYLQGRATERSDLDFFFIPAPPRGREVEMQFVIDGISFDFWPIAWERAERMAAFEEWNTTIIADCELLYVRADEDRERFLNLRETIGSMGDSAATARLTHKAEEAMKECLIGLGRLRLVKDLDDLSYCRMLAQDMAVSIFKALALLNQTYFTRGWGHYREQIRTFRHKPEQLDQHLDTIMFSRSTHEIRHACEQLTLSTLHLIAARKASLESIRSYSERMKGYYEEERGMLNKLLTACETGHYETACFVAGGVQDGLARMLYAAEHGRWPGVSDWMECREIYGRFKYPDLVTLLDPTDYEPLRLAVEDLIVKLEEHLRAEGVVINQFDTVADFEVFYQGRVYEM